MSHKPLYKVEKINSHIWGVYKRDFGSAGGWVLLKTFYTENEANKCILSNQR